MRVRREPVIGSDDDVGLREEPPGLQRVLDAADAGVHERQRLERQLGADPLGVRGSVGIVQPHEGDVRTDLGQPEFEVGVDRVLILRIVGIRMRGRGAEDRGHTRGKLRRSRELVVDDAAGRHRVIQQVRGSARPAADCEQRLPRGSKDLAERGCRQQRTFRALDGFQIRAIARVEPLRGIRLGDVDVVAHQAVRLRIRAGHKRRGVDARHRGKHGVMSGKDHAALSQPEQARHDGRRHVVGPKTVNDDHQMRAWRLLGGRPGNRKRNGDCGKHPLHRNVAILRQARVDPAVPRSTCK